MRKTVYFLISSILVCSSPVCAAHDKAPESKQSSVGIQHYGNETLRSITTSGSVTLDGTTVEDHIELNGKLNANNAKIGSINATGYVSLQNCKIKKTTYVSGSFGAENTTFENEVSVSSLNPTFKGCKLDTIHVRKVFGSNLPQTVELLDGTRIKGNIVFDSGNGKVIVSPDSELQGSVVGADIVYQAK